MKKDFILCSKAKPRSMWTHIPCRCPCFTWTPTEYVCMYSVVIFFPVSYLRLETDYFPSWWQRAFHPLSAFPVAWQTNFLGSDPEQFCLFFVCSFCRRAGRCQVLLSSVEGSASFKVDITIRNSYPLSATESFSLVYKTISICIWVFQIWISAQNVTKNFFL